MPSFAELVQQCPPEVRDNIRYIATDATGHRAGFFDRPRPRDHYWETSGPYYLISPDHGASASWQRSLVRRPRSVAPWAIAAVAALAAGIAWRLLGG